MNRERLHWSIELSGHSHALDLLPGLVSGNVRIDLDGRRAGQVPKPSQDQPWQEGSVLVEGERIVVALIWSFPAMDTDVFVRGRSLIDGRTLDEVRQAAPSPVRGYELWFRTGISLENIRLRLVPPWVVVAGGLSVVALVALDLAHRALEQVIPAVIVTVPVWVLFAIWFWFWLVLTVRTNRYLLRHPELGDARRLLGIGGVFFGWPLVSGGVIAAVAVIASRLA